jgi:outer membrane protein assembly factor BamB
MFGYDAAHTGHGTDVTGPDGPVRRRWHHDLGGKFAYAAPAVADGRVYVHGQMTQVRAPSVRAVGADEGELRWALRTGPRFGPGWGSPTVAAEYVVVPGGWAVEARTGGRVWETSEFNEQPTTVVDGTVHLGMQALDVETAAERWRFERDRPTFRRIVPGEVDQVIWSGPGGGVPAVADGTVFVPGEMRDGAVRVGDDGVREEYDAWGHVHALDATDGTLRWMTEFETPMAGYTGAVTADRSVYVIDRNGTVLALSSEDGSERWRVQTGVESASGKRPTVADRRVFVRGGDGELRALNAGDGSVEWTRGVGTIAGAPVVVNGILYVSTVDGEVIALDARTGDERWSFDIDDRLGDGPVVADGRLYVAGYELHCLEPR